jgi:hypothetical protein
LMILGMIYSMIYWRKVSLKSIKQTQYQWQFLINWWYLGWYIQRFIGGKWA